MSGGRRSERTDGRAGPGRLILASASPRRRELLREAGLEFEVVPSGADEALEDADGVEALVLANALLKARDVAGRCPDAIVMGADTLVALGAEPLAKPADAAEARRMLERLSGRTHRVLTGVSLVCGSTEWTVVETTSVLFRDYGSDVIEAYLGRVHTLDKAGGYAIQEHGELLVAGWEGSYTNVVGLPVERVLEGLATFGVTPARGPRVPN